MKKSFLLLLLTKSYVDNAGNITGGKGSPTPQVGQSYNVFYYPTFEVAVSKADESAKIGNCAFIFELKQLHYIEPTPIVVKTITVTESD